MIIQWNRIHIIIVTVAVLLPFALYFIGRSYYVGPLSDQVKSAQNQLQIQKNLLAKAQQELDENATPTTELQKQLPVEQATDQLLLLLSDIETKANSTINQLALAGQDKQNEATDTEQTGISSAVKEVQYQLQVTSENYVGMYNFIQGLSAAERLVTIEQLEFSEAAEDSIAFSVTFSAYYNPDLAALKVEAPTYEFKPSAEKTTPFAQ
ncbi:hypothetical protein [Aquibacillus kalidii]|uniref:hypothetical protein n=1 Tax=Aquibacillus kalidii TaxID=2762597 RepID=UPI0016453B19|nr:hypothetical protein [Aquibacillus kalidii]